MWAVWFGTITHAQAVATPAELLSGAWETVGESEPSGVFLMISQGADSGAIDRQTVQVRVFRRKNGAETWGWYVVSPTGGAEFDGHRLQVVGLTATFDPAAARWTGRWLLNGQTKDVVLERPHPALSNQGGPLCGDWEGLPDSRGFASTTLHIVQSSDGTVSAWMDRVLGVQDQRFGESLRVASAAPSNVVLELDTATAPLYRFSGVLSIDGNSIAGHWNGLNARESFRRQRHC